MIVEKVFEGFVSRIFDGLASELGKWVSSFDPLRFSKKYKHILTQRHANIKIFGMAKPVNLSNIYIDAIAYEDIPSRVYMNLHELEKFLKTGDRTYQQLRRKSAISFIEESNKVLILGKPGSGKTTLLRNLITKLLSNDPPFELFPLYVNLKEFSDQSDTSILEYLTTDLDKYCEFPREFAKPFLERLLKKGYSIVLLDGLDEVEVSRRKIVIKEIEKFSTQYSRSKVVISCRTADYLHWFKDFNEVELADFTPAQTTSFIKRWFVRAPKRGQLLLEAYNNSSHLQELCSVPIMAALMCILFEYNLKLPENRAELYSECVDSLLYKWDASRLITRQSDYTMLSTQKKKTIFANVAYEFMEEQKVVFDQNDLVEHLENNIKSLGIDNGSSLLKEIASHHGLFVERSAGYWSFVHLTFQEYFSALYVIQNRNEVQMLNKHFPDPRWREIILIVASYLPNAEKFIEAQARLLTSTSIYKLYAPYLAKILSYTELSVWKPPTGKERITTVLGLGKSKTAVELVLYREDEFRVPLGAKKIDQIKAVRRVGKIFELEDRLLESLFEEFRSIVTGPVLPFTDREITEIIEAFGPNPFDKFWIDFHTILLPSLELFVECCGRETIIPSEFRKNTIRTVFKPVFENKNA